MSNRGPVSPARKTSRFFDRFGAGPMNLLAPMMIAHDTRGKILEFDEIVGLSAQVV
jgi:hypothetical protein